MKQLLDGARTVESGLRDAASACGWPAGRDQSAASGPRPQIQIHFDNGDMYGGESLGGQRDGFGHYIYNNKVHSTYRQYRGQWSTDVKQGDGTLFFTNGDVYSGSFAANRRSGFGALMTSTDWSDMPAYKYEGTWKEDQQCGLGLDDTDGSQFFGLFESDERKRGVEFQAKARQVLSTSQIFVVSHTDETVRTPLMECMEVAVEEIRALGIEAVCPLACFQAHESCTLRQPASDPRLSVPRSPMVWDCEHLAAFCTLIGIEADGPDTLPQRLLRHKVTGANIICTTDFRTLLSMLPLPVLSDVKTMLSQPRALELWVLDRALRTLLEADRLDNTVRQKVSDILSDPVLSHYVAPTDEIQRTHFISAGYGSVYRGIWTEENNSTTCVALKEMKGEYRVRLYELLKEARVLSSLEHPNITQFLGLATDRRAEASRRYLVSELLDCSLFDLLHAKHRVPRMVVRLDFPRLVDMAIGICRAGEYLHRRHLVHADLKSSNVLIDLDTMTPKLCDFGHATVLVNSRPTHHRCGTPHWAAPEVLRCQELSPAADIYSFGIILWEMLAGELPFRDYSFFQVIAMVGWCMQTPGELKGVPDSILDVYKQATRIVPDQRPSFRDLRMQLQNIRRESVTDCVDMLDSFMN